MGLWVTMAYGCSPLILSGCYWVPRHPHPPDLPRTTPGPEPAARWTLGPAPPPLPTLPLLSSSPSSLLPAYVLPVKVEMEMVIQQYEKAKVIQDEQLERLTQICQEQGVSTATLSSARFCPGLRTLVVPKAPGCPEVKGLSSSPFRDTWEPKAQRGGSIR